MKPDLQDISSRADIARLVDAFYRRVRADTLLGPIFDDVANVDWGLHLPKMYDFWETVLFSRSVFRGNPLAAHLALARMVPLGAREFGRWIDLFHDTVDASFRGPVADEAKLRASRIATVMQYHIGSREGSLTTPS
jgi:hemoglobin